MSSVNVTELITRAALAADMHDNFATDAWLYWANIEHKQLRVRLARLSFPMDGQSVEIPITASHTTTIDEPLAICALHYVGQNNRLHRLRHVGYFDREYSIPPQGVPTAFSTIQVVDDDKIVLSFNRTFTGTILMDIVPYPAELALNSEVFYPLGFEERIVLGMARRALAKEETINPSIESQIREIDNHIDNAAWSRLLGDSAAVRAVAEPEDSYSWLVF